MLGQFGDIAHGNVNRAIRVGRCKCPVSIWWIRSCWCRRTLQWRHNECDGVSNHQPHDCLLNRIFRRRSKKTPKLRVTGHCEGNSSVTSELPVQRASNTENVSIWSRHRALSLSDKNSSSHPLSNKWNTLSPIKRSLSDNHVKLHTVDTRNKHGKA